MAESGRTGGSECWLIVAAISLVIVGCTLRFRDLDHGVVWQDEAFTGLRVSGASSDEVAHELYHSGAVTPSRLLQFQFPRPGSSWLTTVRELVRHDPKQVPVYYLLARWWTTLFGPSVGVLRGLSAAAGALVLPLLFLLGRELSGDMRVGLTAAALVAVSPLQVVYSQDARPYSLWVLATVLASWLLLVAMRRSQQRGRSDLAVFTAYGTVVVLGLATHALFILVVVGHLGLVVWQGRGRVTPAVRGLGWALTGAAVVSAPLGVRVVQQVLGEGSGLEWLGASVGLRDWTVGLATGLSRAFVDLGGPHVPDRMQLLGAVPLALVLVAVPVVWRHAPRTAARFLLLLALCGSLPLALADLMRGGTRATVIRYHLPAVIAVEFVVAFWIVLMLRSGSSARRGCGIAALCLLSLAGITSALVRSRTEVWWNKSGGREIVAAAAALNREPSALLLSGGRRGNELFQMLALGHRLGGHVTVRLGFDPTQEDPAPESAQTFLWHPSKELLETLARQGWVPLRLAATKRLFRLDSPSGSTAGREARSGRADQ